MSLTKAFYPVIAAVNLNGKLTILLEDTNDNRIERISLSEVLDSEIEFDLSGYDKNNLPADWDYGNIYKCNVVVHYIGYDTVEGREHDSEIYVEDFKLLHAYNKL